MVQAAGHSPLGAAHTGSHNTTGLACADLLEAASLLQTVAGGGALCRLYECRAKSLAPQAAAELAGACSCAAVWESGSSRQMSGGCQG